MYLNPSQLVFLLAGNHVNTTWLAWFGANQKSRKHGATCFRLVKVSINRIRLEIGTLLCMCCRFDLCFSHGWDGEKKGGISKSNMFLECITMLFKSIVGVEMVYKYDFGPFWNEKRQLRKHANFFQYKYRFITIIKMYSTIHNSFKGFE